MPGGSRLQHGQPAQRDLYSAGGGGPRRVACGRVQGETLLVLLRQLPVRAESGLTGGSGFFPGAGMLVVGGVQQVHGLASEEPSVLTPLGHAPHHRGHPAASAQLAQHGPDSVFDSRRMDARLATLARGIRPVIRSSRRCSSFNCSRRAMVDSLVKTRFEEVPAI